MRPLGWPTSGCTGRRASNDSTPCSRRCRRTTVMSSLTVTTPTDREIVLTRTFAASRRLVFDAYTKPELLTQWYGAHGWHLVGCELELCEGGWYRFESRGPAG